MSAQPEALRLADWLQAAVQTYPQMSEDEPGGYATEVDQVMDDAAAELRRLHAEIEAERQSRQAAQIENEALKARIARADVELQRAVIAEREACAKVCDKSVYELLVQQDRKDLIELAVGLRDAIRARGAA